LSQAQHVGRERRGPTLRLVARSFATAPELPGVLPLDVSGSCTSPTFVRKDAHRDYGLLVRCRNCPACLRSRRYQWALRAEWEIVNHYKTWFFTGTFASQTHCLDEASQEATKFLKRLRDRALRGPRPVPLRYLLVPERHKSGAWHFHALIHENADNLKSADIRSSWKAGFSYPKLMYGDPIRAAQYLTKYTTKDLLEDEGKRPRIRASRNPKYGGPVIMSDLEDVQKIMQQRRNKRLDEVWKSNLKDLMNATKEHRTTDPEQHLKRILLR
jgi:hypothetical protein